MLYPNAVRFNSMSFTVFLNATGSGFRIKVFI